MNRARAWYALTLAGYFGTLVLLIAWYGWLAPPRLFAPAVVITVLVLPLFAPLRGLLHARPYTVAWSLFLAVLYFTHGIVEAWTSPAARPWALLEVALTVCWMVAGTLFIRAGKGKSERI